MLGAKALYMDYNTNLPTESTQYFMDIGEFCEFNNKFHAGLLSLIEFPFGEWKEIS